MFQSSLASPIGNIRIVQELEVLLGLAIGGDAADPEDDTPLLRDAKRQLSAWFDGRLLSFDLPLVGAVTERGAILRHAIIEVPYGSVRSYGEVARLAGSSPRAVGQACRHNPFPIIVPCHRVVNAGRGPGHYSAGGGVITKAWLLDHERTKGHA